MNLYPGSSRRRRRVSVPQRRGPPQPTAVEAVQGLDTAAKSVEVARRERDAARGEL